MKMIGKAEQAPMAATTAVPSFAPHTKQTPLPSATAVFKLLSFPKQLHQ